MNADLVGFGAIFIALGFLVGPMKMTRLLSGFNEKRVADKKRLANLVGFTEMGLGVVMLAAGLTGFARTEVLLVFGVIVLLLLMLYVNMRMVSK